MTDQTIHIETDIRDPSWRHALPKIEELCGAAVTSVGEVSGLIDRPAEISCVFADDQFVQDLNRQFRDQDKPTNVLSFSAGDMAMQPSGAPLLLGDIVLAFGTCRREAAEQEKSLEDHIRHLVVHGTLHLLGFDHKTEADATEMEALEVNILAAMGIADPYAALENIDETVDHAT